MAGSSTSEMTSTPKSENTTLADLLAGGFVGNIVVVIGGQGGIGRKVAEQAHALGAIVISASRRGITVWGSDTSEMLQPIPGLDLLDPASIRGFTEWIAAEFSHVDILVNTAGITKSVPLKDIELLDDATIDSVVTSNATGILRLIRDLTPCLQNGHLPVIVNVSSVAARTGVGSNIAYVGAKAAMDAMTVSLAKALAPKIRVLSVAPSALETDFAKGRTQDFIDRTIAATPLGRLATPTEVANSILCAARLLTATTGTTVFVDGGRHL
jgi:3-oxoacyl-[acyl-carrier protein] reductase